MLRPGQDGDKGARLAAKRLHAKLIELDALIEQVKVVRDEAASMVEAQRGVLSDEKA